MIDFKDSEHYIELFGGGASILLNKPRHKKETYIDIDKGLTAMFKLLSKEDTSEELIHELYKTNFSREEFEKHQDLHERDNVIHKFNLIEHSFNIKNFEGEDKDDMDYNDDEYEKYIKRLKAEVNRIKKSVYSRFRSILLFLHENNTELDFALPAELNRNSRDVYRIKSLGNVSYEMIRKEYTDLNSAIEDARNGIKEFDEKYSTSILEEFNAIIESRILIEKCLINVTEMREDESDEVLFQIEYLNEWLKEYAEYRNEQLKSPESLESQYDKYTEWAKAIEVSYDFKMKPKLNELNIQLTESDSGVFYRQMCVKKYEKNFNRVINSWIKDRYDFWADVRNDKRTDIDMAVSAYVVYSQSVHGRGEQYAPNKYSCNDNYHSKILNLSDVAYRMQGVEVLELDKNENSIFYLIRLLEKYKGSKNNETGVFLYCDPPYLPSSESIIKYRKMYDAGSCYTLPWGLENHVDFLQLIRKAPFKVLISGYNDIINLYDMYLKSPSWRKREIPTLNNVSRKMRTEVLWYNY